MARVTRAAVDALVFDVYGTLLDVRSVEALCAEATAEAGALMALWRQKQLEYAWLRTLMDRYQDFRAVTADALDQAAELMGLALDPAVRTRLLDAWMALRPHPDAPPALDRLAFRPLVVLSNGSREMLDAALRAAGLRDRFADVLSVEDVRAFKPAPAVYALAELRLRAPRRRLLFVSANGWDTAGASAFGMRVAWVNRQGQPLERLGFVPDLEVRDLAELADRLQ